MVNYILQFHVNIISYCTRGAYEQEAQRLVQSCRKLGLSLHLQVMDSLGSWQKNCLYKPFFIKGMLQALNKPVLYVDADAVFHRMPDLSEIICADFGVHYFRNIQLASGTLFFNNNDRAFRLLDLWIEQNRLYPQTLDQENLQAVVEKTVDLDLKVYLLPPEYCKIFDLSSDVKDPIIEHFQASRRFRHE